MRIDGLDAPDSTVYQALKRTGRVLEADYKAERRQHVEARRAAFVVPPSGPNQVWQLDFTEFQTRHGGTWRIGGATDYWSKLELGWHVAPTQNHRDAIEAVEVALAETEWLLGRSLLDYVTDHETGEVRPVAVVTDNGPCFKAGRFASFIGKTVRRERGVAGRRYAATPMTLCCSCAFVRLTEGRRGQTYLLCRSEAIGAKYPPQPVVRCPGWAPALENAPSADPPPSPAGPAGPGPRPGG